MKSQTDVFEKRPGVLIWFSLAGFVLAIGFAWFHMAYFVLASLICAFGFAFIFMAFRDLKNKDFGKRSPTRRDRLKRSWLDSRVGRVNAMTGLCGLASVFGAWNGLVDMLVAGLACVVVGGFLLFIETDADDRRREREAGRRPG